ncbi:MAG: hypothetical protein HQL94_03475 [Magnetococcales bacterium]|nr:hypothetical protein [Magnetococcales bacterium]
MKSPTPFKNDPSLVIVCDTVLSETVGDQAETLFLESLVAEANRTLDGLKAVNFLVDGEQDSTSIQVSYRDTKRSICTISDDEIIGLASKIKELNALILGDNRVNIL